MRGSDKTTSIFSANSHAASEQGSDVRPSLDAFVASVCSAIRVRGNLGRPLPVRGLTPDHLEAERFGLAVVR